MNKKSILILLAIASSNHLNGFSLFAQPKKLNRVQRKMVKYFTNRLEQEKQKCVELFRASHPFNNQNDIINEAIIYAQDQSFIAGMAFPVFYTCARLEDVKEYFNSKLIKHRYLPVALQHEITSFINDIEHAQRLLETSPPYRIDRRTHSYMRSASRWLLAPIVFFTL